MEVLEFLLEYEVDVDATDKDGWMPIHAAACWGNVSQSSWQLVYMVNPFTPDSALKSKTTN